MEVQKLKKRLTIELHPIKHAEIKSAAAYLGISIREFIDQAVMSYVESMKGKK